MFAAQTEPVTEHAKVGSGRVTPARAGGAW